MASGGKNLIYGLTDPRTGEIRYIGKSTNGIKRAKTHRSQVSNRGEKSHKASWIRQLEKLGLNYGIVVLEKTLLPSDLGDAERRWIAELRAGGTKLTNMTDGGDGAPGRTFVMSEEQKQKLRGINLGKKLSPETRKKLSEAGRGRTLSVEIRRMHSERMKGNTLGCGRISSKETRKKLSEAAYERFKNGEHPAKGLKRSEATKAKIGLANSKRVWTEESKAKQSESQKRRWLRKKQAEATNGTA